MLRTNLSSRPFYNARSVRLGIAVGVVLIAAFTAFNTMQIVSLNRRNGDLAAREQTANAATAQLRDKARVAVRALDQKEIELVQASAREANQLIDRRAFSWTDLFNRFEETLPADVRIAAVQPQVDDEGRMLVAVTVVARRAEDLHGFLDRLEATGAFSDVLQRQESTSEDGLLHSIVQGYYGPSTEVTTVPPAATSDTNGTSANRPAVSPINSSSAAPRSLR